MDNVRSKPLNKVLAVILSLLLVFSLCPFSIMAYATPITDVTIEGKTLTYTGDAQNLVDVTEIPGDTIAYYINSAVDPVSTPTATDVGEYTVRVVVTRDGADPLEETVVAKINPAEIELGNLVITALDREFDGIEKPLIEVTGAGDYTLKYSLDALTWGDDIPVATDAGVYTVYVKAVKANHNDKETDAHPITVTISKKAQNIQFVNEVPAEVVLGTSNEHDFAATGDNLSGNDIEYSIVNATDADAATISADGKLTVAKAGIVTVKALRLGNETYEDAVVYQTVVIKNESTELVTFDEEQTTYIFGPDVVSEKIATKSEASDNGAISYSIDRTDLGLSIDEDGKIIVTNKEVLFNAMKSGTVEITVTANKLAGSVNGKQWLFDGVQWTSTDINKEVFAEDSATYVISAEYTSALPFDDVCAITVPNDSGWYNDTTKYPIVTVKEPDKYQIALNSVTDDAFKEGSVTIEEQGAKTHYIYLKDKTNEQIYAGIPVDVKVDTIAPDKDLVKIEYEEPLLSEIVETITFGFYKPSVTVKLTAYDETSGIDNFTVGYRKATDASTINHPENMAKKLTDVVQDTEDPTKYTAEFTITADEYSQYRGYLLVQAEDKAKNISEQKSDADNVFIVDTINPEMSIKYASNDPYTSEVDSIGKKHYFDGGLEVELTIVEANFYKENISVSVTKDGQAYDYGTITWEAKNANDETVGKFSLAEDGNYVVTVNATDKSGNIMDPSYTSETIVIDTKKPVIGAVYSEDDQTITITVDEKNFRASDITIASEAHDINNNPVTINDIQAFAKDDSNWTHNGDKHVLVLESTENSILKDAIYNLTIGCLDISNNSADVKVLDNALIDHTAPDASKIKIEYSTSILDSVLSAITLGFYDNYAKVDITFTAYDDISGVKEFKWFYDRQAGASTANLEKTEGIVTATADDTKLDQFTGTITLPLKEAEQLRGHISVQATDNYGNTSDKKVDNERVIIVDSIGPKMTVEYSPADQVVGTRTYNSGDVEATLTVTEANFFAEDVIVTASKDGATAKKVNVKWEDESVDSHIGKFTLSGDGDYVVYVQYKDRSENLMTDEAGNVISHTDKNGTVNKYKSHVITIDTINPVIKVTYDDEKVPVVHTLKDKDGNERTYYAGTKTATVTITEHNFDSKDVVWDIVAKDVSGKELKIADLHKKSKWTSDGDVHTMTITYPGDANYTFDMAYTDLAKRKAKSLDTAYFTVDKTAPTNLKVEYSTSILDTVLEKVTFGFYKEKTVVTITAEDSISEAHSFLYSYLKENGVSEVNSELVNKVINAKDIKYSDDRTISIATFKIPKVTLDKDTQFNGVVAFSATDRASNTANVHKETKRIVVDNIAPTVNVGYNQPTNATSNVYYYDGNINATVTINEANFYAEDVQVMVSKNGGTATKVTPKWEDKSVDVHIGTFTLSGDGHYIITIDYTDKSSNKMVTYKSKQMTIDTSISKPTFTINGAAKEQEGGAYKGDAVIGFNFVDENFDVNTIRLTRTRFNSIEDVTSRFVNVNGDAYGGSGSFTIPSEEENDGIYVLNIGMTDKVGHKSESQMKFVINRHGSVYEYNEALSGLIKDGGKYVKEVKNDLVITEYNADSVIDGSLQILITRDGEALDAAYTTATSRVNGDESNGGGWYQYVYTINASNFEEDGVYKISLNSRYTADDSADNESTSVPENSRDNQGNQILDAMNFTVDSEAPEIRNIVNLDKKIADKDKIVDGKLNIQYTILDVGGLKSIEVIVNGETIQSFKGKDFDKDAHNFIGNFDLKEQNGTDAHKVQIKVTDLAGNVTDTSSEEFLKAHSQNNAESTYLFFNEVTVSRNFFVRWYANTPLFWGSIIGVVALGGGSWSMISSKRKKKEEGK